MTKIVQKLGLVGLAVIAISARCVVSYQIYNLEDPKVCNATIWLDRGPNSAAILRLTSRPAYDDTPRFCVVTFKASKHAWSGLLGVLEKIDLRKYDDVDHPHAPPVCMDYISITNPVVSSDSMLHSTPYRQEQCGSWSVHPDQVLPTIGYSNAVVGHCSYPSLQCEPVRELMVQVVIGRRHPRENSWQNTRNFKHKGFTFVVTAYSFSYGVNECANDLRSCGYEGRNSHPAYCVHDTLFCDGHINCGPSYGVVRSTDERNCNRNDKSHELIVATGPWMSAGVLIVLIIAAFIYRKRIRTAYDSEAHIQRAAAQPQAQPPDFNSYAESYEVSSNVSTAPHMAIQVRVVCNPATQPWPATASGATIWKADHPPSYEALFPHGPPQEVMNIASEVRPAQFVPATAGTSHDAKRSSFVSNAPRNSRSFSNDDLSHRVSSPHEGNPSENTTDVNIEWVAATHENQNRGVTFPQEYPSQSGPSAHTADQRRVTATDSLNQRLKSPSIEGNERGSTSLDNNERATFSHADTGQLTFSGGADERRTESRNRLIPTEIPSPDEHQRVMTSFAECTQFSNNVRPHPNYQCSTLKLDRAQQREAFIAFDSSRSLDRRTAMRASIAHQPVESLVSEQPFTAPGQSLASGSNPSHDTRSGQEIYVNLTSLRDGIEGSSLNTRDEESRYCDSEDRELDCLESSGLRQSTETLDSEREQY
ncbi:uncharacterized protein LOC108677693 [Hyalella azteca]|uniref:Uncharacterized protein LOC108677693 n=1 Tax=Hyalella azteca TaxID=294128 RepID=A0A8B7P6C4_HYAAZ|nr:uncharacterized protein LOC108677693 [Hyalella azteca]